MPTEADTWFPDTVAAPLALLLSGGLVVVGAVWVARRSREQAPR